MGRILSQKIYEQRRSGLVHVAARSARCRLLSEKLPKNSGEKRVGKHGFTYIHDWFTQYFHEEMDKLVKAHGLGI